MEFEKFYDFEYFYQINFLSKIKPEFLCGFCRRLMKNATQILPCGCRFCHGCLERNKIQCCGQSQLCKKTKDGAQIFPDNGINKEIRELKVKCPHCDCKMRMKEVRVHLESCKSENFGELFEESVEIRKDRRMSSSKVEVAQLLQSSSKSSKRLPSAATFQWRIKDFNKILEESKRLKSASYFSDPFYMDHGYRMKLIIYPNGNGIYTNSHVSLYYVLLKGDLDHCIEWPFNLELVFIIYNEESKTAHSKTIPPNCSALCNQRPQEENVENGVVNFLPIKDVGKYTRGRELLIKLKWKT